MNDVRKAVKAARELCGCSQCQGGYEIGAQTLAMPLAERRPHSCLAGSILDHIFDVGLDPTEVPVCAHGRPHPTMCPWCNGINTVVPPDGYTDASAPTEYAETGCSAPGCEYGMGHSGPHGEETT